MKVESSVIQNKFLRVRTLNYGASLFEIYHKKKKINLILNLGSIKNYRYKHPSVGSTCGRYAGRISNSNFSIRNKKYSLSKNNGKNTLHGGKKGFQALPWKKIKFTKNKIVYELNSNHLDQGFPANLLVKCLYQLNNKFLTIKYEYVSDKPTHVNLTNHSYWNLNRIKKSKIFDHDLLLNSNKFLEINQYLIPTGKIKNTRKTIYDFTSFQNLKEKFLQIKKTNIKKIKGYDTTFVLNKKFKNYVGSLKNDKTKIKLDFYSDLPSVQLYTSQNLKYKKRLRPYEGICLETQYFPDSPNKKKFPSTLTKSNKINTCFTKIKIN